MTAKEIIKLAVFQGKQIRKIIHDGEWWFAVVDVVEVLTESPTPRQYWGKVKKKTGVYRSPVVPSLGTTENGSGRWQKVRHRLRKYKRAIRQNLTDEWKERGITASGTLAS